jgi:purine catabolism regulator
MVTVQDVLTTKAFQNTKVLADTEGLSRIVSTITVAEVPDAANWLRGGELVCTTAYFIGQGVKYEVEWIESLFNNGASALAIKTSRFLGTIPKSIIDAAKRLHFPLIEMPPDITWPVVIESVMNLLTDQQTKVLQQAEEIYNKLTTLVLENDSIQVIADTLASLVGNPIVVEDARLNLIAVGTTQMEPHVYEDLLQNRLSESFRKQILQTNFYKNALHGRKKEMFQIGQCMMIPILSNKIVYGFISFLEHSGTHTRINHIALEHGATALALQFMKQIINEQTYRTKTMALIDDLVNGRFHTEIVTDHNFYKIDLSNPMIVVMVESLMEQPEELNSFWNRSEQVIGSTLKKHIKKHFDQIIIGNNGPLFNLLVSFSPGQVNKITRLLEASLKLALAELEQLFGAGNFRIGIGSAYKQLQQLEKCYKEANVALSIAKTFPQQGSIILFEHLGIHRIFSMIHRLDDLRMFSDDFLLELKAYDVANGDVLMGTLHAYLRSNCNVNEAAKMLYVHPNTVSYRIRKIQNIIRHDFHSMEVKLIYLFALEANMMLG